MAMANSLSCSTSFLSRTKQNQENFLFSRRCLTGGFPTTPFSVRLSGRQSQILSLVVTPAASGASVEAEPKLASVTPSKTLPFRVGHGFDLHRLEPGYPLIIGGISIPHDRGCEAHSDGITVILFLFILPKIKLCVVKV